MTALKSFLGEMLGTAILVFFGCGSVAIAVLFNAYQGLFQIAMIWGIGVTLAIYSTRHLSGAHLNPAVSIAMACCGRLPIRSLPTYVIGQFLGALLAALLLYGLLGPSITEFELLNHIVRGTPGSVRTAMMFGEFYPNPGAGPAAVVSTATAFMVEAAGTFLLVVLILALSDERNAGRPSDAMVPLFIGLSVTVLISILAPLTQAGFNPARDLAPRLLSMWLGWGTAALPDQGYGFLTVYVAGPIAGGIGAAAVYASCTRQFRSDVRSGLLVHPAE